MPALQGIRNCRRVAADIVTAGQPTAAQLADIAAAGFEVVINLLPRDAAAALPDEEQRVAALGLTYVFIPVAWEHPTAADLHAFSAALDEYRGRRLFIHCAANYRVAVFLALHRVLREGWDWETAEKEMRAVWEPDPVWQAFVAQILRARDQEASRVAGPPARRGDPWLRIPAADYEAHMGPAGTDQLAALSAAFAAAYARRRPRRVLILGCATGNGFEHVDPRTTREVIGVDINPEYLALARRRFGPGMPGLRLICARAEECAFAAGSFDLVSAGLIFEYLDPAVLVPRLGSWLAPGGLLSVVLQLPATQPGQAPAARSAMGEEAASEEIVSPTGCASLRPLAEVMRLVDPEELGRLCAAAQLRRTRDGEVALRFGKRFHVGEFVRS